MPLSNALPTPSSVFPVYLLPSLPFRRRSSASSAASTNLSASPTSPTSGNQFPGYLSGHSSHLRCSRCLTDLCLTSQIISKGFTGRHGRAYLVAPPPPSSAAGLVMTKREVEQGTLPNTHAHKPVPRQLVTGAHTVSDISCAQCGSVLGWKYVAAEEEGQRYKVGKFILETRRVSRGVSWENDEIEEGDEDRHAEELGMVGRSGSRTGKESTNKDDEIEFDSQDEDECEDLFAGIWSPSLARRRRKNRNFLHRDE